MNWDDKVCHAAQLVDHDPDMIGDAEYADGYVDGAVTGAKWQRDQLRTNEAIERVARGIARMEPDEDWDNGHELDLEYRQECFETAIDAIAALLGEDA